MTRQKSLKRRVRARMQKTGERYTAARRQVLGANRTAPEAETPQVPAEGAAGAPVAPEPGRESKVGEQRFSDEMLIERTGRGWEEWFALLDARQAAEHRHAEVATLLTEEHGVPGWWAQTITVGYEQARGLRVPGQRLDGTYEISATKMIGVSAERAFDAFAEEEERRRWLPDAQITVRTATRGRSLRANWEAGGSRVNVGFDARGEAKTQVAIQHERLTDATEAARLKAFWRERLSALKAVLEADQIDAT